MMGRLLLIIAETQNSSWGLSQWGTFLGILSFFGVPALAYGLYRKWKLGHQGRTELIRIYETVIPTSTSTCDERLRALLNDQTFLEQTLFPDAVTRQQEWDAFRSQLHGSADSVEIQRVLNEFFDGILTGLSHASYAGWQQKAKDWKKQIATTTSTAAAHNRRPVYMVLGLLKSGQQLEHRADLCEQHFDFRRRGDAVLLRSGEEIQTDASAWRSLIYDAWKQICEAELEDEQIHLVLGTVTLWNLAFGRMLNNKHPGHVLYHVQDDIHPIWTINRAIKDRRSPNGAISSALLDVAVENETAAGESEAVVLSIGANHIENDVRAWLNATAHDVRLRVVTKKAPELPANQSEMWVQYATEMADLISQCGARDIYLFADMPAVLALMVGDGLGPYKGNLHLMQFTGAAEPEDKYVEVLSLPDEELDRMFI